ncbi:MAG: transporter substrate-binding domain-containing protein [Synergistaceae bacterium]|jgi:polar amino acid transport system substrate-binding protein|nr:transporter substrate-binding domain-containing protein [Synergistaceae bacterium]
MKKISKLWFFQAICLLCLFVFATGTAEAAGKLQEVLSRGKLLVGTGSTNVPWHLKNNQGEYEGMDIEMGKILARGLFGDESKVEFIEQAPDQRIPNLLANKVDICLQFMTITPARAQQIAFTVPYYTEGIGLILATKGQYKKYEELVEAVKAGKTVTIAILQNADAARNVQRMLPGSKDDQYENQGLVYQAVTSGRADAGAVDLSSIKWLASKQPELYIDSGFGFNPQLYGGGVKPDELEWLNYVNTVFIDCMAGSTYVYYNAAYEKWFGEKLPAPPIGKPLMYR